MLDSSRWADRQKRRGRVCQLRYRRECGTETAVLENKRLGGLLTLIRQSQQSEPPGMRTSKGPKRRDQTKHMFSVG